MIEICDIIKNKDLQNVKNQLAEEKPMTNLDIIVNVLDYGAIPDGNALSI